MQQVITEKQAREITGGRKPLVPVEYESAVKSLEACMSIDESKYWSDKADALAAWAKIYRNDDAGRKAKMLKLHAYRRMGILALELRPHPNGVGSGGRRSEKTGLGWRGIPGPADLLMENGLKRTNADAATRIARLSDEKFDEFLNAPSPPSPLTLLRFRLNGSEAWKILMGDRAGLSHIAGFCRSKDPLLARMLATDEVSRVRGLVAEIVEWFDAFEQALPKEASGK